MEDNNSLQNPDEKNNTPSESQNESTTSTQPPEQSQESDTQAQQSTTQGPTSTPPAVDEQHSQQAPPYPAEQYPPLPPPEQYPAPPLPQPQLYPPPPPPYPAGSQGYRYQPQPIPYPQADTYQQIPQPQVQKTQNTTIIQDQPVATVVTTNVGDNFLTLSIVMTFLCFFTCSWLSMLCTIIAIFFALAAQEAEAAGDFNGARNSSGIALMCNIIAMIWWIVVVVIIIITVPLVTLNKCVQSGYYHYGYYYYCYY